MAKSTRKKAAEKPKKPYKDFPLGPANNGCWQKKIKGKIHYFGRWGRVVNGVMTRLPEDGWKEALDIYKAQIDDIHAGRTPRSPGKEDDGLTVMGLCNKFLTAKHRKLESGELSARSFAEYRTATDRLLSAFGKSRLVDDLAADDFDSLRADLAKQYGPVRLGTEVQKVRSIFRFAFDNHLVDRPVRFGTSFTKPSRDVLRKHRAKSEKRLFTAAELTALLGAASPTLKAMILLGLNCGFGQTDVASLPMSAVDLETGWIDFPRPKNGIERRCPLWPETVEALRAVIADRPEPKDPSDAKLVFLTQRGRRWVRLTSSGTKHDMVIQEFGNLLRTLKLNRKGVGFYALRHTFRTIADSTRDFPAIRVVMGHTDGSIDAVYRETIDDDRLRTVVEHVRSWLFPEPVEKPTDDARPVFRIVG